MSPKHYTHSYVQYSLDYWEKYIKPLEVLSVTLDPPMIFFYVYIVNCEILNPKVFKCNKNPHVVIFYVKKCISRYGHMSSHEQFTVLFIWMFNDLQIKQTTWESCYTQNLKGVPSFKENTRGFCVLSPFFTRLNYFILLVALEFLRTY